MKNTIAAISLLGALVLSAAPLQAMPPAGPGPDPERMVGHLQAALDLDAGQVDALEALLRDARADAAADRERLRELRDALHDAALTAEPEQLHALSDDLGRVTAELVYSAALVQRDILALLSPEQAAGYRELLAERRERMEERRERLDERREHQRGKHR